ncbi:MAG: hypothetical protein AAGK78_16835 [Planctomycetota bacterium]
MTAALDKAKVAGTADANARPVAASDNAVPESNRPISFNAAMVRALLAGQKTETRRPVRPLPTGETVRDGHAWPVGPDGEPMNCRLAAAGERLWVREPWAMTADGLAYEADFGPAEAGRQRWRPGRFMAKSNCRLWLDVTNVQAERLSEITPSAAEAEGFPPGLFHQSSVSDSDRGKAAVAWFRQLWDSIYGDGEFAWRHDPWVWAIHFKLRTSAS